MDEQNSPVSSSPIYQESQGSKNAKWLWLLIALIIVGAIGFAVFRGIGPFGQLKERFAFSPSEEESGSPSSFLESSTPSPEATSEAEDAGGFERSEVSVRVLNGSGVTGAASSAKDFLEGLGYKVISIGNADASDYEQTEIRLKRGSGSDLEEALSADLSDKYSVAVSDTNLDEDDEADAEVILGAK